MSWAVTFHVKLEAAGGRVIYKISLKTDNVMNGSNVKIIKITIFQTKSDDAANWQLESCDTLSGTWSWTYGIIVVWRSRKRETPSYNMNP